MGVDDEFLDELAKWSVWWISTHAPGSLWLAPSYEFSPPPLLGVEDERGSLGEPDWQAVERILKEKTELFFHWRGDRFLWLAGECPVLDEVSKIVKLPDIAGEIYIKCEPILSRPTGANGYWVFHQYPILWEKIAWTLTFCVILKEGLRYRWREQQRKRRDKTVSLDAPIPTDSGEVSLHETIAAPVVSEPSDDTQLPSLDDLFTRLTKREREVANLSAAEGTTTSIAEVLGLTPRRVRYLLQQLRRKYRGPPKR